MQQCDVTSETQRLNCVSRLAKNPFVVHHHNNNDKVHVSNQDGQVMIPGCRDCQAAMHFCRQIILVFLGQDFWYLQYNHKPFYDYYSFSYIMTVLQDSHEEVDYQFCKTIVIFCNTKVKLSTKVLKNHSFLNLVGLK